MRRNSWAISRWFRSVIKREQYTFEEWLAESPYTTVEREVLTELFTKFAPEIFSFGKNPNARRQHKICRILAFNKEETYPSIKFFRTINGRHDLAKVFFGPLIKSIERVVYNSPFFVKHIPWAERSAWFKENFSAFKHFYMTDYTSFEASFTEELCDAVEKPLYEHMLGKRSATIIMSAFYGTNTSTFSDISMSFKAKRCSGDVNTSLGNAWANMVVIYTLLKKRGVISIHRGRFVGPCRFVVEGDDGFIGSNVPLSITPEDFSVYGLTAKIEVASQYYLGSFCGMVFDPDSLTILADPIKSVLNFGWASSNYVGASRQTRLSLLRAKALSYAYLYPQCPIIWSLAKRALTLTRGVRVRCGHFDVVGKWGVNIPRDETVLMSLIRPPSHFSRLIVEKLWKIPPDVQISIEEKIGNLSLGSWSIPELVPYIPRVAQNFIHDYISDEIVKPPKLFEPNMNHFFSLINSCIKNGVDTRPAFNPRLWRDLQGNYSPDVINVLQLYSI